MTQLHVEAARDALRVWYAAVDRYRADKLAPDAAALLDYELEKFREKISAGIVRELLALIDAAPKPTNDKATYYNGELSVVRWGNEVAICIDDKLLFEIAPEVDPDEAERIARTFLPPRSEP